MYSNYLAEVGKLVYILGQIETTSAFKKMLDSNNDSKTKFYFKCLDELPPGTFKKIHVECRRRGILKCDWFNKIIDKSPMMIFMVFNYCQPLQANEKWEDRLSITIRKINKVYEILRTANQEDVVLRVIIIISKQTVLQSNQVGNIVEKITNFLKSYEKQLVIYQSDQLTKEVNKNKSFWFTILDKAYQKKYKAISKRKQQSFGQARLGCLIKMAVISQIISKKDSYSQYDEAYRSLHFRFVETMKNKVQFFNFDSIRELRTLADVVLLRRMIVKLAISSNFQNVPETISNHLKFFYQSQQSQDFFYSYENMIWRENFLQNLLEVLHINDHVQIIPKSYFAHLINSAISLSYKLCKSSKELDPLLAQRFQIKGRIIPTQNPIYIGSRNYALGVDITDLDVIWTEMTELMERKKDFVTRGLQTITRYKSMKLFKKHEVSFFNVYLLRFYLADEKFGSIGNIFNEIIRLKISQYDFYSLNYLIDELEKQTEKSEEHRILIHSLALLIADYFKNKEQLQKYGAMLMKILPNKNSSAQVDLLGETESIQSPSQFEKDPFILPLPSQSLTFSMEVLFTDKLHMIEKPLQIVIIPKLANKFLLQSSKKAKLKLFFNKRQIKCEREINFGNAQDINKITIKINPLQYFSRDEVLQLKTAVLITETSPQIHFLVEKIYFPKYRSVILITKLKQPEISISLPYQIFYFNEISKLVITTSPVQPSTKIEILFSISEQHPNNTEIFLNLNERLNLINSNCFQPLNIEGNNIIYLKCNKIGAKILKFLFNVTIVQHIGDKQLKDHHVVTKEIGFRVVNLFKTIRSLKESFTGAEIKHSQVPTNKNIIMAYNVRAVEAIRVVELGQHTSPKPYFKTHKDIKPTRNYLLPPEERLKNIYIFEVLQQFLKYEERKQLFLISFYIKWSRMDMNKKLGLPENQFEPQIINVYNEDEVKISLKNDKVEVEYEEGKSLRKRQKQSLSIKYRNLTNDRIHVYSLMDSSDEILRVGSRGNQVQLGPKETKTIVFEILPVKIGYFKYPNVRSFFDGIEAKEKSCNSIICVL